MRELNKNPYYITARDLAARGKEQIPPELISNTHLIYSSPATLAFNSPGAQGFGVKRAGLAIPGSVMLLVAPGCCGRNTTLLAEMPEYHNRFFYLMMDETDIVTGRHLTDIPQAVEEICQSLPEMPSVVMICLTCADALLGTDMERICRKAMKKVDIPVLPCYMYALTREGRKPPMVHVRQSIYSLLNPMKRKGNAVNLLGYFAHLIDDCELYDLLGQLGIKTIREISRCENYQAYLQMAAANFNLVLNPEARFAAQDMQKRLGIPSVELTRLYQLDKIQNQYRIFASALGASLDDQVYYDAAKKAIDRFRESYPDTVFSIGEGCNAEPFELALALLQYGFGVAEIFGTPTADNFVYIKKIAALSPDTKIYSNLEPTMLYYDCRHGAAQRNTENTDGETVPRDIEGTGNVTVQRSLESTDNVTVQRNAESTGDGAAQRSAEKTNGQIKPENREDITSIDVTIGRDAAYYHPGTANVEWSEDVQPFGYAGVKLLFEQLLAVRSGQNEAEEEKAESNSADSDSFNSIIESNEKTRCDASTAKRNPLHEGQKQVQASLILTDQKGKKNIGLRKYLAPFAPDQSGASAVLEDLGGIVVICDAGGCAGNICGFDEPRWFMKKSAIFSAGLRDMDAILGRDDRLVEKLADASDKLDADFAAIVGTPVPAIIGTDYKGLKRMAEKKIDLPVLTVDTTGMELYDAGAEKAWMELFKTFADIKNEDREIQNTAYGEPENSDSGHTADKKWSSDTEETNKSVAGDRKNDSDLNRTGTVLPYRGFIGVIGLTPLDILSMDAPEKITLQLQKEGWNEVVCYGMGAGIDAVKHAASAAKNLVTAPSGLKAARYLQKKYGTPYEIGYPTADTELEIRLSKAGLTADDLRGKKILVVHQQVIANEVRNWIHDHTAAPEQTEVTAASWFMLKKELRQPEDIHLTEENEFRELVLQGGYDIVIGDLILKNALPDYEGIYVNLPHFAVSGEI